MKKALVLFIIGVTLFAVFTPQNVNAQNANIAQRIIGTWSDNYGDTWVFNANGTLIVKSERWNITHEYKYVVTDKQLSYYYTDDPDFWVFNFSMSSDGKMLILNEDVSRNPKRYLLTKK